MTLVPTDEQRSDLRSAAPGQYVGGRTSALRRVLPLTGRPAFIVVLGVVFFYWLAQQSLDSIEKRSINQEQITQRFVEHLELVAVSTVLVILIAVPLGIALTRPGARRISPIALGIANMGQAIPSIGVLVLLAMAWGVGFRKAIIALVAYSLLPVLRNTMVGIRQVDPALIDAGRGMGLTKFQVLRMIELPIAVPIILAGIRVALILNVGTATLAVFTNAGGLGAFINVGIILNRTPVLLAGSVLAALLALTIDWLAEIAERVLRPRGL
ncbi:MAG: ABC transporter permease [Streptosporangiales bacterium]